MTGPVALTGATGFLGSHIAEALLDRGISLRCVVRRPEAAAWAARRGAEVVHADLGDETSLRRAFGGASAVVHNAAMGSWQGDLEAMLAVNRDGTRRVFDAAASSGIRRVVQISSVAVVRTSLWWVRNEDATPYGRRRRWFNPSDLTTDWRYALSKALGEEEARRISGEKGLDLTVLRPGPIYGARDPKLSARWRRAMQRRLLFAPTVGVPLVHAGDVASACVNALERPATSGGIYNLAGPPVTLFEVYRTLRRLLGKGPMLVPLPLPVWVGFDCARAVAALDFRSRELETGLEDLVGSWTIEESMGTGGR